MKITNKRLKQIIKEEKTKLLNEMNPMMDTDRMVGTLVNVATIDKVTDGILDLMQEVEMGSQEEEGLGVDEAAQKARNAAILVVAQAFQAAGETDVYFELTRMIR